MAFGKFRSMTGARIATDFERKNPQGFGFVFFTNIDDAQKAIAEMNGQWIAYSQIDVICFLNGSVLCINV